MLKDLIPSVDTACAQDWDSAHIARIESGRFAPLVVTAASANHFDPLQHLLKNFDLYGTSQGDKSEPGSVTVPLIVYDMGLHMRQRHKVLATRAVCSLVPFDVTAYPSHVDLHSRGAENLTYAFKPIIFKQVADQVMA